MWLGTGFERSDSVMFSDMVVKLQTRTKIRNANNCVRYVHK